MNLCLFDLDHTLLPLDSDHAFGEFMVRLGWADADAFRERNEAFFRQYREGGLDIHAYVDFATAPWRDRPPEQLIAVQSLFMEQVISPCITAEAIQLVREHEEAGDLVAIVTATNEFVTQPIAMAFGVDHLLAIQLERDEAGTITGRIAGVPTFRDGKVERIHQWLASQGHTLKDFERVTCYSDSPNDLPMLELASDPVATNPSTDLRTVALERGWRVLDLFE